MGFGFDWDREISSIEPEYYKWTQWLFTKFYEQGLAEFKESPVWWCEKLKTVLSEEEVIEDASGNKISERGEHPVVRRNLVQWVLKITDYAEKLLEGLDENEFPESVKSAQPVQSVKRQPVRRVFQSRPVRGFFKRIFCR